MIMNTQNNGGVSCKPSIKSESGAAVSDPKGFAYSGDKTSLCYTVSEGALCGFRAGWTAEELHGTSVIECHPGITPCCEAL